MEMGSLKCQAELLKHSLDFRCHRNKMIFFFFFFFFPPQFVYYQQNSIKNKVTGKKKMERNCGTEENNLKKIKNFEFVFDPQSSARVLR